MPGDATSLGGKVYCRKCGGDYREIGFRKNDRAYVYARSEHRAICIGCEQTARDEEKQCDRAKIKARDALRRHADRFIKIGLATNRAEFARKYGWNVDRMIHDLKHIYENTCCYCWRPFAQMGHGLADISIDICDPKSEPNYMTNTKWCCRTCNQEKSRTPPADWGAKLVYWKQWAEQQARITQDRLAGLPLFETQAA